MQQPAQPLPRPRSAASYLRMMAPKTDTSAMTPGARAEDKIDQLSTLHTFQQREFKNRVSKLKSVDEVIAELEHKRARCIAIADDLHGPCEIIRTVASQMYNETGDFTPGKLDKLRRVRKPVPIVRAAVELIYHMKRIETEGTQGYKTGLPTVRWEKEGKKLLMNPQFYREIIEFHPGRLSLNSHLTARLRAEYLGGKPEPPAPCHEHCCCAHHDHDHEHGHCHDNKRMNGKKLRKRRKKKRRRKRMQQDEQDLSTMTPTPLASPTREAVLRLARKWRKATAIRVGRCCVCGGNHSRRPSHRPNESDASAERTMKMLADMCKSLLHWCAAQLRNADILSQHNMTLFKRYDDALTGKRTWTAQLMNYRNVHERIGDERDLLQNQCDKNVKRMSLLRKTLSPTPGKGADGSSSSRGGEQLRRKSAPAMTMETARAIDAAAVTAATTTDAAHNHQTTDLNNNRSERHTTSPGSHRHTHHSFSDDDAHSHDSEGNDSCSSHRSSRSCRSSNSNSNKQSNNHSNSADSRNSSNASSPTSTERLAVPLNNNNKRESYTRRNELTVVTTTTAVTPAISGTTTMPSFAREQPEMVSESKESRGEPRRAVATSSSTRLPRHSSNSHSNSNSNSNSSSNSDNLHSSSFSKLPFQGAPRRDSGLRTSPISLLSSKSSMISWH